MRLFKLFTTALLLGLIGLFFYENATVFHTILPFTLDLYIREQANWTHPLYVVLLFAVLLGFLAGIGVMIRPYLHMRQMLAHERQEKESAVAAARQHPVLPGEGVSVGHTEPASETDQSSAKENPAVPE